MVYQSKYKGSQVDKAIGKILNGGDIYVMVPPNSKLPDSPALGNENKIHLIQDPVWKDGEDQDRNKFIEYIWIIEQGVGKWERLGQIEIKGLESDLDNRLSNYVKKTPTKEETGNPSSNNTAYPSVVGWNISQRYDLLELSGNTYILLCAIVEEINDLIKEIEAISGGGGGGDIPAGYNQFLVQDDNIDESTQ